MPSKKKKLEKVIKKVFGGEKQDIVTSIWYLIKELKCLSDIVGREYEVIYEQHIWYKPWTWGRISKILQKPIKGPTLITLFNEMKKDYKRQETEMKKAQTKMRKK